ncbi:hypothetical protein ABH935_004508 [Catenulispora sp. GAS73]|uniref:hypothetical protein n=1 Tax=Catenulispora sp. GAS73 TaxID=3156269 RepID=UPI0035183FC5
MSSVDFLADLGPTANAQALTRLLSAAAAPPWPHELRGYESARRAFENAGKVGATPFRRGVGVPLRRLIGVKMVAVAGALTVTGVAVAAEADVLPSPIQRAAHQMLGGAGVPDPGQEARAGQPTASSPGSPSGQPDSNRAVGDRSSSGGSSLPGTPAGTADAPGQTGSAADDALTLCRAHAVQHENGNGNGNSGLNDHDRARLAAMAGGEDKIDTFCAQVLAGVSNTPVPQPSGGPSTSTSPSATPDPSRDHKPVSPGHTHTPTKSGAVR